MGEWYQRGDLAELLDKVEAAPANVAVAAAIAAPQYESPGRPSFGFLRLASNVADGETVTIGADVYEFDDDAEVEAGRILVDVSGGLTPEDAADALVAALAEGTENVGGLALTGAETVVIVYTAASPGAEDPAASTAALATTETLGGANNAWGNAVLNAGKAPAQLEIVIRSYVATAADVAIGLIAIPFAFTLDHYIVQVRDQNGAVKAWDGGLGDVQGHVQLVNSGLVDFAANDTIQILAVNGG